MEHAITVELSRLPQRAAGDDTPDLRPRTVTRWLQDLPLTNLGQTCGSILETLKDTNRQSLGGTQRLQLLESLRPTLGYVLQSLRKHYLSAQYPPSAKAQQASRLSTALIEAMITGYELVVDDHSGRRGSKKRTALALQRIIRYSSTLLLDRYCLREAPCPGVWRRMHQSYARARTLQVETLKLTDRELRRNVRCTLSDSYKQILLLAAADPHAVRHQELDELFAKLERLAPLVSLNATSGASEAAFAVDLEADLPPWPCREGSAKASVLVLDCSNAAALMRGEPKLPVRSWRNLLARRPSTQIGYDHRLSRIGRPHKQRRFARRPMADEIHAVVGISHISRMLAREQGLQSDRTPTPDMTVETVPGKWVYDEIKGWRVVQTESSTTLPARHNAGNAAAHAGDRDLGGSRVIDTSATGYCLALDAAQAKRARVGQAIAIWEADQAQSKAVWQIGLIRWIRQNDDLELLVGVELVGADPEPVLLRPKYETDPDAKSLSGLKLPAVPATGRPEHILAPRLQYVFEEHSVIRDLPSGLEILLTQHRETTSSLVHFDCSTGADLIEHDVWGLYASV